MNYRLIPEGSGIVLRGDRYGWALFSECSLYRYALGRMWNPKLPQMLVGATNPSKATHEESDPSVRKIMHYARRDGFGGFVLVNAFALRSTNPRGLLEVSDPIGPHNHEVVHRAVDSQMEAVGAWGPPKWAPLRDGIAQFAQIFGPCKCWHVTTNGYPGHPLYLPNDAPLRELQSRNHFVDPPTPGRRHWLCAYCGAEGELNMLAKHAVTQGCPSRRDGHSFGH